MKYVDYKNCIVGIPNSILNYFGISKLNVSNPIIDEYLEKYNPKNIVLILCDGMGHNYLNSHLLKSDFLIKNEVTSISSVFPTTTTAATTSIITGLYPNEHCWLGWDNYVAELDKVITMFLNKEKDTNIFFDTPNLCNKIFPYKTIFEYINESKKAKATYISPYSNIAYKNIDEMCEKIKKVCDNNDLNFIYAYYENPDSLMHQHGIDSPIVFNNVKMINNRIEKLGNSLEDTLLIVTADHGLTNNEYIYLEDDKELFKYQKHTTSIDSRATMFFIKENYEKEFQKNFFKKYKNDFILLTTREILNNKLFGIGKNNKKFESCLGDFIAISITNKGFKYIRNGKEHLAGHSGLTNNEIVVPLILYYAKNSI